MFFHTTSLRKDATCLRSICFLLFVALFFSTPVLAQVPERVESKLPANTIFSVSGDNLKEAWSELNKTQLGITWFGKQFDPLRKALVDADMPSMLHLRPWWGFDWDELKTVDSEAAFVLIPDDAEMGAVWWFGRDPKAKHVEMLRASTADYFEKKKGLFPVTGKFDAAEWITYVKAKTDDPKKKAIGPVWVTGASGVYAAGNWTTANSLAKALAGKEAALATTPGMKTAIDTLYSQGTVPKSRIRILAKPLDIAAQLQKTVRKKQREAADAAAAQARAEGKEPKKYKEKSNFFEALKKQGGDSIQAIGLRFDMTPGEAEEVRATGVVVIQRPLTGGAQILDLKPTSHPQIPEFIPDDVGSVLKVGFKVKTLIDAFRAIVKEAGPNGQGDLFDDVLNSLRDDPSGPRLDVRKQVFDELEDSLINFTDGKHEPDRRAGAIRRATLIPVKDPVVVAGAATRLWSKEPSVTTSTFRGTKAYSCPTSKILFRETDLRAASVWVESKTLALGNNDQFFFHVFNPNTTKPLVKKPDFIQIDDWWKRVETPRTVAFAYLHPEHLLGNSYGEVLAAKIMKDDKGRDLPEHPMTPLIRFLLLGDFEIKNALKPASLPPAEVFLGNWRPAGFTLAHTEVGLQLDMVWLGKEKPKVAASK